MTHDLSQRVRRAILHQPGIKIFALVLAVVIFYGVRGIISNTVVYTIPVELDMDDVDIAILDLEPASVRVTLRGAISELRQLAEDDISVVVRPRSTDPTGEVYLPIRARHVRGRGGARVANLEPHSVRVAYDRQDTRIFPVAEPLVLGKPARGRVEIDYEPREVQVRGAVRHLDWLGTEQLQLHTEPVDVEGRMQSFSRRVRVVPPDETWLGEITPGEITVRVNIVLETVTREIGEMPVAVAVSPGVGGHVSLAPSNATIRVSGRADAVNRLAPEKLTVFVDARELGMDRAAELPLQIFVPQGLGLETVTVEPRSVRVSRQGGGSGQ